MRPARALVVAALLLASSLARADADAHQRYEQGVAAFQSGDFATAAAAFADVYKATGETKHLWNLAFAEYQGHAAIPALGHLREYVGKPDANPKNLERAKGFVEELTKKITRVTLTAPQGASIEVDGAAYGVAPLGAPIELDPAKPHTVVARRGVDEAKQVLTPQGGKSIDVTLSFPVAVPGVAPAPAVVAAAPPAPVPSPPSPVATTPSAPEPAAAPLAEAPTPHRSAALRNSVAIGLGVGALVGVGLGVYFGVASNDDANDAATARASLPASSSACSATPAPHACSTITSDISSENSDHTASIIAYVAGGALAAGAIAAFLLIPRGGDSDGAHASSGRIVPMVAPGTAGAGYVVAF